ncbi:MAG: cysteine desulfurase, partial [Micromonosporaceae bacterium]
ANTSQKPRQVIEAIQEHYRWHNANVARAMHTLGAESTEAYEGARAKVAAFIGANSPDEVVFAKNSSEAINLLAYAFANTTLGGGALSGSASRVTDERFTLGPGDEVVISEMEHHSNIVPWQLLCERTGATLRWFGVTDEGRIDWSQLDELVNERTKIVSYVHASNILGTINPTSELVKRARQVGALVMLDCSQSVPHMPVNVQELDVDFICFTGHKMYGPTGVGVLWGRRELLELMPPFLGGGEMIEKVAMERSTFAPPPHRFEAGTPMIAQVVGLGAAVDYLSGIGMEAIRRHEKQLTAYALAALEAVDGVRIVGPRIPIGRGGTISFMLGDVHPHDVGQVLDAQGIAVRVGQHCARPVCLRYGIPATTRASLALHTTKEEVDALAEGLEQVRKVFG